MSEDKVHRAERWRAFYGEEGGLKDMFDTLRDAYLDRAAALMPNDTAALLKLGIARKIVSEIEGQIVQVFNAGKIAAAAQDHADKIARLPEARRRFM